MASLGSHGIDQIHEGIREGLEELSINARQLRAENDMLRQRLRAHEQRQDSLWLRLTKPRITNIEF
jgi:hypothetical protein